MELLIMLFGLAFIIFGGYVLMEHKPIRGIVSIIVGLLTLLITAISMDMEANTPVIIEKSPDSEWELSERSDLKADTCITEIRIVNQTDTVYPTTCYKILRK